MRDKRINIKLSEQEKQIWETQAELHNLSMSDYIRFLVMKDLQNTGLVQKSDK